MTNLQDRSGVWKSVRPFIIGGLSACTATCCIQPIDMVTRFFSYFNIWSNVSSFLLL